MKFGNPAAWITGASALSRELLHQGAWVILSGQRVAVPTLIRAMCGE